MPGLVHVDMHASCAARHRHGSRHRLRHRHAGIGKGVTPEPAVVGQRLASQRADRRIGGLELIENPRDGCRIERGTALHDEQQRSEQRRDHRIPGWRIRRLDRESARKVAALGNAGIISPRAPQLVGSSRMHHLHRWLLPARSVPGNGRR